MEKVNLTSGEFLSVYTGILLGDSFDVVCEAEEKIFGFSPMTLTTIECAKQFRRYINTNNPELAQKVKELGIFEHQDGKDISQEIKEYCTAFETLVGSKYIQVDKMKFKENEREF